MTPGAEQRRAPRTLVDVEARLQMNGQTVLGFIQDLSPLGALFVPEKPIRADTNNTGHMRFHIPPATRWLEPNVEARRTTTFTRANGEQAKSIGLQFSGLRHPEEEAIAEGCREWGTHRTRQYPLQARCYVQGEGRLADFMRFGTVTTLSRSYARILLPTGYDFPRGSRLILKAGASAVPAEIEQATATGDGADVLLRLDGWGRDFFMFEIRK